MLFKRFPLFNVIFNRYDACKTCCLNDASINDVDNKAPCDVVDIDVRDIASVVFVVEGVVG